MTPSPSGKGSQMVPTVKLRQSELSREPWSQDRPWSWLLFDKKSVTSAQTLRQNRRSYSGAAPGKQNFHSPSTNSFLKIDVHQPQAGEEERKGRVSIDF